LTKTNQIKKNREFGCALFNTGDKTLRATSTIGKVREGIESILI